MTGFASVFMELSLMGEMELITIQWDKRFYLFIYLFCLFFFGAGMELRASHKLGEHSTTELRSSLDQSF
jgi:hypothetical protein